MRTCFLEKTPFALPEGGVEVEEGMDGADWWGSAV